MAEGSFVPPPPPASLGPHACRLALKLAEEVVGPLGAEVLASLIHHGTQQLPDLIKFSGLPPAHLKTALLVLIQQNFVSSYLKEEPPTLRGPGPSYTLYQADLPRVLQTLRLPAFIAHVEDRYEQEPTKKLLVKSLLKALAQHGRLRWDQVLQAVLNDPDLYQELTPGKDDDDGDDDDGSDEDEVKEEDDEEPEGGNKLKSNGRGARKAAGAAASGAPGAEEGKGGGAWPPDPDLLRNIFKSLVLEHFVERAPPANLPPPRQEVHPNARKKRAQPKPGSEEEAAQLREQGEDALRQEYLEVRFTLPRDLLALHQEEPGAEAEAEEGEDVGKTGGKRKRGGKGGGKQEPAAKKRGRRKGGDAAGGENMGDGAQHAKQTQQGEAAPVVWRLNNDEFNRRFRNEIIIDYVKRKHGPSTATAVEGLLLANRGFELSARAGKTVVLSTADAAAALRRQYGPTGAPPDLSDSLLTFANSDPDAIEDSGTGPGGAQYVLNLQLLLNMERLLNLQGVIRSKYGVSGMRIWRLLLEGGQLEQKAVADLAMVTKEEAREALYAMLKAGFLGLQDVPRTADHAPSRTFYTWRADAPAAMARMASDLYRAAGNVHARLCFEVNRRQELNELLENAESVPQGVIQQRRDEIERLKLVTSRLEAALVELDGQILLYADV